MSQRYKFKDYMYTQRHMAPYYYKYKGHEFVIDHKSAEADDHVWLICVTDPNVHVNGYVHFWDLKEV